MTTRGKCAIWLLVAFISGAAVGATVSHFLQSDRPTQQTSFDWPQLSCDVIEQVTQILNQCEPDRTFSNENDFGNWLSDHLRERSDYRIETRPSTPIPDILIENALAIELKVNPDKSERDRCVGQCVEYAQRWKTMVVLLDTPPSSANHLDTLLDLAGLEEVPVFELSSADH